MSVTWAAMGDQSFARLIKRRRDALGFSQARLGELVGRSASTIRNWERGNSTPSERSDAVALAAVLGLDEREVLEGAGFDVATTGEHQTVEQAYASLAPEVPRVDESVPQPREAAPREEAEETEEPDVEPEERSEAGESELDRVADQPDTAPTDSGAPEEEDEEAGRSAAATADPVVEREPPASEARPWRAGSTEVEPADERPVSRPISTPPPDEPTPAEEPTPSRRLSRAAPPTVLEATPPGEPSYLEDPQERQQYRIRAVVTAALVIGLFIVLMWAFGRASDAFSALWNNFFDQLRF